MISREKACVFRLPSCVGEVATKVYDEASIADVYTDAPDNGFSLMIVPASSKTHHSFAINAPRYKEFAISPLAGWVSGVLLDDPAKPVPKVFDGRSGQAMADAAVVFHASLPILTKMGATVVVAENGRMAVEIALASRDAGNPFDVILMDMQMPVLDGYQATQRLRRQGWSQPIIALTANAMAEDRQKGLGAGCDDYLAKPIDRRQLLDALMRLVCC